MIQLAFTHPISVWFLVLFGALLVVLIFSDDIVDRVAKLRPKLLRDGDRRPEIGAHLKNQTSRIEGKSVCPSVFTMIQNSLILRHDSISHVLGSE